MRLTDSEYIEMVKTILDDPRSIRWYDDDEHADPDEVILRTGVLQDPQDDEWKLTEGARGL